MPPAESRLLWTIVEAGSPHPRSTGRSDLDGHEINRVDPAWSELRIAVEYNGYAAHVGREEADAARRLDLERRGWIIIEVTAADMRHPALLVARLRAAFARRGC